MTTDTSANRVFEKFGLALYQCQCVERQLAMMIPALLNVQPGSISRAELESLYERIFRQTFGTTVKEIDKKFGLPSHLEERIQEALSLRNWLAHDYFWDRSGHVQTPSGKRLMIAELEEIAMYMDELDQALMAQAADWTGSLRISPDAIAEELRKLRLRAEAI